MRKHYQKGDAHAVVIVCLVAALACALGLLFYQNYVTKNQPKTDAAGNGSPARIAEEPTKTGVPAPKLVAGSINASFGVTLNFMHPESWQKTSKVEGPLPLDNQSSTVETVTLTSPSGKYSVVYKVGAGGGLGGMCDPSTAGKYTSVTWQSLSKFSSAKYVEYTTSAAPKGTSDYDYGAGLVRADALDKMVVGQSSCGGYMANIIPLDKSSTGQVQAVDFSIHIKDASTADVFKAALSGTEYEQAKSILLSTEH